MSTRFVRSTELASPPYCGFPHTCPVVAGGSADGWLLGSVDGPLLVVGSVDGPLLVVGLVDGPLLGTATAGLKRLLFNGFVADVPQQVLAWKTDFKSPQTLISEAPRGLQKGRGATDSDDKHRSQSWLHPSHAPRTGYSTVAVSLVCCCAPWI